MLATAGLLMILFGFGAFFFVWSIHIKEIAEQADEKRASAIADDLIRNADIRVVQRLIIKDEMH